MTSKFEVGDLIWAKVRYCPAWPAKVVNHPEGVTRKNAYYVFFYGSENYAWVKPTNISSYVDGFDVKRDFRCEIYRKAVKEIANIFHEQQLENGYDFIEARRPKRTLEEEEEEEERPRKIQGSKKVPKKKVNKKKVSSIRKGKKPLPLTIKVRDLKKYFIPELHVGLKRIDFRDYTILVKDSDEPECICVEDQPPTLLPEQ